MNARIAASALLVSLLAAPALAQAPRPAPTPAPARPAPPADPLTEANLSRDALRAAFQAGKLATNLDPAGNLLVRIGTTNVNVLTGKGAIRLLASFAFAPRATYQEKLDLANRINDSYIVVRASVPADRPGDLMLDYYVMLGTGVSRANLVGFAQRFVEIVTEAVATLDSEHLLQ